MSTRAIGALACLSAAVTLTLGACASDDDGSGDGKGKVFSGKQLILADYGGPLSDAERANFSDSFAEETGAEVIYLDSSDPNALAYLQAQNENVQVDIVLGASAILADNGYLADFPAETAELFEEKLEPGSFTNNIVIKGVGALVIACNTEIMDKCPANPQEFWDLENFPGPRAALADPEYNMNIGLLAAGVPADQINPPDIDQAIASWEKVKPGIDVWSTSGAQQMQLITDGEVGAQFMYNGRAFIVKRDSMPELEVSWEDCTMGGVSGYGVMNDAPNQDVAFAYLEWIANHPEAQAKWATDIAYSVPGKGVLDMMPAEVREQMPSAHDCPTVVDNSFRNTNSEEIKAAWQAFLGE